MHAYMRASSAHVNSSPNESSALHDAITFRTVEEEEGDNLLLKKKTRKPQQVQALLSEFVIGGL